MYWIELWAKFQIVGVLIGIACIVILLGMVAYAYLVEWLEKRKGK